jgi:predicted amidohydrolase YtcJ
MTSTTAPDLILHGGPILTLDDGPLDVTRAGGGPVGDLAVAIGDGRIMVVGAARDVLALASGSTRLVDLQGAAVLPGFQDQHAHPLVEGLQAGWLDLTRAPDLRAALRLLAGAAAEARSSVGVERWVEAWYHPSAWREGRHPTRDELDRIVPDVPLLLHHGSGHAAVANSLALAYAGITAERPDPPGATIERDDSGEPTGMVMGSDPAAPFAAALPPLTPEMLRDALRRAGARLAAAGVTAVADAHLGGLGDPVSELAAYAGAVLDGDFPQRLTVMPGLAHLSAVDEDPPTPGDIGALVPPDVRDRIRVGPAKFFSDGALSTGDAWLREAYADAASRPPELSRGRPAHEPEALEERLRRAHLAGWQLATHAIGDAGIDVTLDAYRRILSAFPRADHRHRVEHAMVLQPDLLRTAVELEVVAVIQPEFVTGTGDVYLERLGERTRDVYAYRRWLDAGLRVAFSSDRPFARGAPLDGVRAAFRIAGPSGRRLHAEAGPHVGEALRAWTAWAAWAARDEGHAGRIVPGLAADLVVLSADPATIAPEQWAGGGDRVEVLATLVSGRAAYGEVGRS